MLLTPAAADLGPPIAGSGSELLLLGFLPSEAGTVSGRPAKSTGKDIHCSAGRPSVTDQTMSAPGWLQIDPYAHKLCENWLLEC